MIPWWLTLVALWLPQLQLLRGADSYWCDPKLCGGKHLLCDDNGKFHSSCPKGAAMVDWRTIDKNNFVQTHNAKRQYVSGGKEGVAKASRMSEMKWDDELAKVAGVAVRQCKLEKLDCPDTPKYPYAGQNEALEVFRCKIEPSKLAKQHLLLWYSHGKGVTINDISRGPPNNKDLALYLQLVRDKADRVGCAISRYIVGDYMHQLMKCVYSCSVHVCHRKNPVYLMLSGNEKPGDRCNKQLPNTKYSNLCYESSIPDACNADVGEPPTTTSTKPPKPTTSQPPKPSSTTKPPKPPTPPSTTKPPKPPTPPSTTKPPKPTTTRPPKPTKPPKPPTEESEETEETEETEEPTTTTKRPKPTPSPGPGPNPDGEKPNPYDPPSIPWNPPNPGSSPIYPRPSPPPFYSTPPRWSSAKSLSPPYWEQRSVNGVRKVRARPRPRPRPNQPSEFRRANSGSDYDFLSDYVMPVDPCNTCVTISCKLQNFCI